MATTKEQQIERAALVRVLEASCKIDYPTEHERNFRLAVMKKLGVAFGLREMRTVAIAGGKAACPHN